jgi:hypothetical protein
MHHFSVDYRKRDGKKPGTLVNRGFFLNGVPRPLLICHALGHWPVVDGTEGFNGIPGSRWVCCDRCGIRPDPQGTLDPAEWDVGQRYTGAMNGTWTPGTSSRNIEDYRPAKPTRVPGPWPKKPTGALGSQLIIGKTFGGWNIEVKVGNCGSEHTLAAHISLNPLGALYLHTEDFGTWLQRRLNPVGYDSRVIRFGVERGGIEWQLWAKRNEWSRDDPWWMRGRINLDPRDQLFGRRRYAYEDIGDKVTVTVRMPHGDDHQVVMQLQTRTSGRNRRRFDSFTVDWTSRPGIPTKPHGGEVCGAAVDVSADSVEKGTWPAEAAAAIAAQMTADRTRYGYRPRIAVAVDEFDVEVD